MFTVKFVEIAVYYLGILMYIRYLYSEFITTWLTAANCNMHKIHVVFKVY